MPAPLRRRKAHALLVSGGTALAVALGAGAAAAAVLGLSSAHLTVETYPSAISPTTCTLTAATADSYVNQASAGSNFGTATTLDVRSSSLANRRTFVQFALGPCSIPANALITQASLRLFLYAAPTASRTYEARRVTATWTETGITWTNQPGVAASATATAATGTTSNVTLSWNVTADVQAFVDGTANFGWRIADETENSSSARTGRFRSAEYGTAAQRPVLEVTYYP